MTLCETSTSKKLLNQKTKKFIHTINDKLLQIQMIKKENSYRIYNNELTIDTRMKIVQKITHNKNYENIYNFIRINIDHSINLSQIILSNINNIPHENIYNKHFNKNIINCNLESFNDNIFLLFILTQSLSKIVIGLNNLNLDNYHNILIFDIKKIIVVYILNNLQYLFKHLNILIDNDYTNYNELINIQNNIMSSLTTKIHL